jgi:hypothetical protein
VSFDMFQTCKSLVAKAAFVVLHASLCGENGMLSTGEKNARVLELRMLHL